ncbi:amidohydrolase family protein [Kribbella hippodromi]|uniref:Amidohydrolase family protein n=2 Tax=Kribbella hippodromi TaxID=434347 RepID=A0ABN2DSA2_9ACTN
MMNHAQSQPPLADAHIHLFADSFSLELRERHPEGELAQYEGLRSTYGIEDALVIGFEGDPRFAGNNAYILGLAAGRSWLHPVMYVDESTNSDRAAALLDRGYEGISLYVEPSRCASTGWMGWANEIFALADARRSILSINAPAATHATIAELAGRHPRARILLGHLGLPGVAPAPDSARLAATRDLVLNHPCWIKLSGTYACARPCDQDPHTASSAWMHWLLESVGTDRLIWGSDFSPALAHMTYQQTIALPPLQTLPPTAQTNIYGATLRRLLASGHQGQ